MPSLKDALQKPANVGEPIETAAPQVAQRISNPPYVPNTRGDAGLAIGSMGPAPASFTTSYDSVKMWIRPGVSQSRFPPLPTKANPQLNSATRSIVSNATAASSGSIELTAPSIFTLTDQTVALPGPLVLALSPQTPNTVFAGPALNFGSFGIDTLTTAISLPGLLASIPPIYGNGYEGTSLVTGSATPTAANEWALFLGYAGCLNPGYTHPTVGWTSLYDGGEHGVIMCQNLATTAPVSVSVPITSTGIWTHGNWSSITAIFKSQPNVVNTYVGSLNNPLTGVSATVGNTLLICVLGDIEAGVLGQHTQTFTSTNGDIFTRIAVAYNTNGDSYNGFDATQVELWMCLSTAGGSFNIASHSSPLTSNFYVLVELNGVLPSLASGVPTFRPLVDADLPVVDVPHGGTGIATLIAHNVLLGEGTSTVGFAPPISAGYVLTDNGTGLNPTFQALPYTYYQTVEQATVAKTQRPILNFIAPITATDDAGNTSTDIAVPVFVGSGASHATGLVPDPGASAGTTKFLREDGTWAAAGGAGTAVEINGAGVSSDKLIYINGTPDGAMVWGIDINGSPDGG